MSFFWSTLLYFVPVFVFSLPLVSGAGVGAGHLPFPASVGTGCDTYSIQHPAYHCKSPARAEPVIRKGASPLFLSEGGTAVTFLCECVISVSWSQVDIISVYQYGADKVTALSRAEEHCLQLAENRSLLLVECEEEQSYSIIDLW